MSTIADNLWAFLVVGYAVTVATELPILVVGLRPKHSVRQRAEAALWLTAFTYPIVILAIPAMFDDEQRLYYLLTAETFAPAAECVLFWWAYNRPESPAAPTAWRDYLTIIVANLVSFALGELAHRAAGTA